ncbi:MAG TPA: DUF4440 domain-containing protein [Burkholderiaceae bacterium]
MKMIGFGLMLLAASASASASAVADEAQMKTWQMQARSAECSFAATMAKRDPAAFERHLAEPTVFFNGRQPQEGRAVVMAAWKRFFDGAEAPFSWEPDQVVVVGDGSLAYSTGLVRSPKGELIGRFASVWRQESPGRWRIIIDRGVELTAADREKPQPMGKGCEGLPN